ncbi:hypothetical protein LT337_29415 [Mycolicibacterium fortuitum]|nr:hypothetical protein LT337_29415 [Mycolicibacterium fortuitum]
MSTGVPSRQRANAGLDQNSDSLQIIFREGTPARDPQVLIIALAAVDVDGVFGGIDQVCGAVLRWRRGAARGRGRGGVVGVDDGSRCTSGERSGGGEYDQASLHVARP